MRRKNLFALPVNFEIDNRPIQWGKGSPYGWGYNGTVTKELWKPICKYKDLGVVNGYWASNYGRVYSQLNNLILKQNKDTAKRPYVKLRCTDGKSHNLKVHRLVLEAFVKNPLPKLLCGINHRNGNIYDNRLGNLEYITNKQNMEHYWHEIAPHIEQSKTSEMKGGD